MTERERIEAWYARHGCHHAHCPEDCPHPQPFLDRGVLLCGRCWHKYGERSPMVPCIPEVCD